MPLFAVPIKKCPLMLNNSSFSPCACTGVLGVMPSNTANYLDEDATGGASTIPPSRFGGNVDDFRIGKGGTMYYRCEVCSHDVRGCVSRPLRPVSSLQIPHSVNGITFSTA